MTDTGMSMFSDIRNFLVAMWKNAFFRILLKIIITAFGLFFTYGGVYLFLRAIDAPEWLIEMPLMMLMIVSTLGMAFTILLTEGDVC